MASSSPSSSRKPIKHEVFLSFRGVDTRNIFTSHLYAALRPHGIVTFIDNRLDRGEEIEPANLKAIEESYISVIILSKHYITSPWCLDELVKIFECRDMGDHKVIRILYHVDPTDVDNQTECFGEALAKHKNALIWRNVLSRAANLSGEVITESRLESEFVEVVVKEILKHLKCDHSSYGFKNLVGMQLGVSQVESLLCIVLNDVRMIGIWAASVKELSLKLKISYEGLDLDDQQIFLNIAFMFKGEPISHIVDLLDACDSSTLIGLRRLADKSLIITSNGKVDMHDLLQEMGRQIICEESEEAEKRSRL